MNWGQVNQWQSTKARAQAREVAQHKASMDDRMRARDEELERRMQEKERRLEGFASAVSSMSNTLVELHSHGALLGRLGALVCRYPYIHIYIYIQI